MYKHVIVINKIWKKKKKKKSQDFDLELNNLYEKCVPELSLPPHPWCFLVLVHGHTRRCRRRLLLLLLPCPYRRCPYRRCRHHHHRHFRTGPSCGHMALGVPCPCHRCSCRRRPCRHACPSSGWHCAVPGGCSWRSQCTWNQDRSKSALRIRYIQDSFQFQFTASKSDHICSVLKLQGSRYDHDKM